VERRAVSSEANVRNKEGCNMQTNSGQAGKSNIIQMPEQTVRPEAATPPKVTRAVRLHEGLLNSPLARALFEEGKDLHIEMPGAPRARAY
jgi:hypothetical protein